jgi:hypothetical protein
VGQLWPSIRRPVNRRELREPTSPPLRHPVTLSSTHRGPGRPCLLGTDLRSQAGNNERLDADVAIILEPRATTVPDHLPNFVGWDFASAIRRRGRSLRGSEPTLLLRVLSCVRNTLCDLIVNVGAHVQGVRQGLRSAGHGVEAVTRPGSARPAPHRVSIARSRVPCRQYSLAAVSDALTSSSLACCRRCRDVFLVRTGTGWQVLAVPAARMARKLPITSTTRFFVTPGMEELYPAAMA